MDIAVIVLVCILILLVVPVATLMFGTSIAASRSATLLEAAGTVFLATLFWLPINLVLKSALGGLSGLIGVPMVVTLYGICLHFVSGLKLGESIIASAVAFVLQFILGVVAVVGLFAAVGGV